jgi:DNA helicase II / ATP-dependent DNA helicase PcrA
MGKSPNGRFSPIITFMTTAVTIQLTDQQQAVVDHDQGPALVFAVAGAGKTTAMVHRIERLVREQVFPANQILATSFGRANVVDLKRTLAPWPYCQAVDIRTLHSLGLDILRRAQRHGHLSKLRLNNGLTSQQLLNISLAEARRRDVPYKRELDTLDRTDFLDYIGFCKGNLWYADLRRANLPKAARKLAKAAKAPDAPLDWYLDFYRIFEQVRLQNGAITFDDMLMSGWEALVQFPEVLAEAQAQHRCVLVDEFQDINLVQSAILDLITEPERHYMAIGDDDQTIYEWRGADPSFILNFAKRYKAATYFISDNFRCPAAPLLLANRVIGHNRKRQPKRLSLTRGFFGETAVFLAASVATMSRQIVDRIVALHRSGVLLNDMAVLVRLNAQTPYIEQFLIEHKLPYRVSQPFYERAEIKTLIEYGRLAWFEQQLQSGHTPWSNPRNREAFNDAWRTVCNRPKRYLTRDLQQQMAQAIVRGQGSIAQVITIAGDNAPYDYLAERLDLFGQDIAWLAANLDQPVYSVLRELETRLVYKQYLRESSGFPQTGEGRAVSVEAFMQYARDQGSFLQFMGHIRQLAEQKIGQVADGMGDAVTLTTIHRAKGLEWPVVFMAQCNDDIMPFRTERTGDIDVVEEERRLFYVALTRTKEHLSLYCLRDDPLSPFLHEANYEAILPDVTTMTRLLTRPDEWGQGDRDWVQAKTAEFHLQRYFEQWFPLKLPFSG